MVYLFEKMICDDKDLFIVRESKGNVLCATTDPKVLVEFYKNLGV